MTTNSFQILLLLFSAVPNLRAELLVSTDFEGGSALVESIDSASREIHVRPGGDPARGWPCWWFVRIDGLGRGESATLVVRASDRSTRNNGKDTGKPLSPSWAMPAAAAVSEDGKSWRQTELGTREPDRISYPLLGTGGPIWVAWGPPFTSRESDAMITAAEEARPGFAASFELARSREGRPVRALRFADGDGAEKPAVWVQARQHAWESGSSWVAQGFVEWITGDETEALRLRETVEIVVVPIVDIDRVTTGDGGKEADPRDHNRDWSDDPHYPEIAATQKELRTFSSENRLAVFLDLHNPGANDRRPFFFVGPPELLAEAARENRQRFLTIAAEHIAGPLVLDSKPHTTLLDSKPPF